MSDLVSVAANAVLSYQRALGTVSNNIANVGTEGYSRQEVVLKSNPVSRVGTVYLGTGVSVESVKRQFDTFVEANLRKSNSDLASQEPMVNYSNRVIDIMGSSSMGLTSAIDQFFSAARNLSSDPGSTVMRSSFVRDSENLASRFGELSAQLDLVQSETDEATKSYVNSMNTIFSQLAVVNTQLTKNKSASDQPANLLDQRDALLKDLSSYAQINTLFSENGQVTVSLGPSITKSVVVSGVNFFRLGTTFNSASPEKVSLVLDPYGIPEPITGLKGGKLSGLLAFREQVLNSSRSSIDTLAQNFVKETNAIHKGGIDAYGNEGTDLFSIEQKNIGAAGTVRVAFKDALRVSAAAQFRVIEAANNTSGSDASISYVSPLTTGPATLSSVLRNNPSDASAVGFAATVGKPYTGITTIPNGIQNVSILMGEPDPGQQLQVFTRDGRQLVGGAINSDLQSLLIKPENGFEVNASYSSAYLNTTGIGSYKGLEVFYGAKAEVGKQLRWDMAEADPTKHSPLASTDLPALLRGGSVQTGMTSIANGLFTLNGRTLSGLSSGNNGLTNAYPIQATNIASWINNANIDGITATASNEIVIPANKINLSQPLSITKTGVASPATTDITAGLLPLSSVSALVAAINGKTGVTNVIAKLADDGGLILTNASGFEGQDINIATVGTTNALGLSPQTYGGSVSLTRPLTSGVDTPIKLGFTAAGTPSDLFKIGFKTGAYIKGGAGEDLMVFLTGSGDAKISASYTGAAVDTKQVMRNNPFEVRFESATRFSIVDTKTNTKVAERTFNPLQLTPAFVYQGIQLSFTSPPQVGDVFTVDGNKDGTGNNENMLLLVDLESKPAMGGGKTFSASYIDNVNNMGNIARQASIAQTALKVVFDQAVSSRDSTSGVSLDEEAADLIRYQQAYQAAAKVMQMSSQLFDSVLQIR